MSDFSRTNIDRTKRIAPMKTKFQGSKNGKVNYYGPENGKAVNSQFSCNIRSA